MHTEAHLAEQFQQSHVRRSAFAAASAFAACALLLAWYAPTTASIVSIWSRSETYAHGFAVVPIVLWLIWRDRARLATVPIKPTLRPVPVLVLLGLGWLLAELASVLGASQFMLVGMVPVVVWSFLGTAMVRALVFPLGFLFFAVPFGDFIVPVLMDWTADVTVLALRATGVPVLREGNNFTIPTGTWSVVEACSGVRYLIASILVGTLFARLTYRTTSYRLAFIGLAIGIPVLANWIRAYLIVMLGHLSGNRIAVGVDHIIYGWIFFGVVMTLLFWLAPIWLREPASDPAPVPVAGPPERGPGRKRVLIVALAVAAAALPWRPILAFVESRSSDAPVALPAVSPVGGWSLQPNADEAFRPDFAHPAAERLQTFTKAGDTVVVFIAYYRNQTQASELISQENRIVTTAHKHWIETDSERLMVTVGSEPVDMRAVIVRDGRQRLAAWQWYWIDGRLVTSDVLGKVMLAFAKLTGKRDDSAAIVVYAQANESGGADTPALRRFTAEMGDSIARALEAARRP